jgi:hypothetical protein
MLEGTYSSSYARSYVIAVSRVTSDSCTGIRSCCLSITLWMMVMVSDKSCRTYSDRLHVGSK